MHPYLYFRWWVAGNASQHSAISIGQNILTQTKMEIDRMRNIFKFLLGNIPDNLSCDNLPVQDDLLPLDRYILHCLTLHCKQIEEYYTNFHYNKVVTQTQFFIGSTLSSFYFDLIKDRLYCDSGTSKERMSANKVLWHVLNNLQATISPILPVLCREVTLHSNSFNKSKDESSLLYRYSTQENWVDHVLQNQMDVLIDFKKSLISIIGTGKSDSVSTKDLNKLELVLMPMCESTSETLATFGCKGLQEIFQVAKVEICSSEEQLHQYTSNSNEENYNSVYIENDIKFRIFQSKLKLCPRCRLYSSDGQEDNDTLCSRCNAILT